MLNTEHIWLTQPLFIHINISLYKIHVLYVYEIGLCVDSLSFFVSIVSVQLENGTSSYCFVLYISVFQWFHSRNLIRHNIGTKLDIDSQINAIFLMDGTLICKPWQTSPEYCYGFLLIIFLKEDYLAFFSYLGIALRFLRCHTEQGVQFFTTSFQLSDSPFFQFPPLEHFCTETFSY